VTEKLIGDGLALLDLDPDGVGHLRLNRPEASNGMNVEFLRALHDAILTAHGEPRLRVLLLSGEGPNFCAGGDVKTFARKGEDLPDYLRQATSCSAWSAPATWWWPGSRPGSWPGRPGSGWRRTRACR